MIEKAAANLLINLSSLIPQSSYSVGISGDHLVVYLFKKVKIRPPLKWEGFTVITRFIGSLR